MIGREASSYEYDVFLSFRGKDTRLSFTDHLYEALIDENIRTFLDEEKLDTGEELKPELAKAIKSSRASIIVLSENFASSTWCLDELVMILEHRKTSNQFVLPIFYHVKPTYVRKQKGSFGEAMAKHKQMLDAEKDEEKKSQRARKLELWTIALAEVADLKGKDAYGRLETVFIEEILEEIRIKLGLHLQGNIPKLIGMESSIDFVNSWIKDNSSNILTIWGMAGTGKTSLAEYVYKLHCREFERSSFVEGIGRKCAEQSLALLDLQKQLLGDVLRKSTTEIHDVYMGTNMIERALLYEKTLLVLDDIHNYKQLDLLIRTKFFGPGTKIIITTTDGSLTEKCALFDHKTFHTKHKLSRLSNTESLRLLCWHAFGTTAPKEGYEQKVMEGVKYCGGNPLTLKVLGGSLINEDIAAWSYIFEREVTETILKECGIRTSYGIMKLTDRSLISIGEDNKLNMDQLVQEMGRDLVRQESPKKPWKRSRLWNHEESLNLLIEDKGTSKVCGLALDMKMSRSNYVTEHKLQAVIDKKIRALSLIQWIFEFFSVLWGIFTRVFLFFSPPRCRTIELRTNALAKMDKLNLLQLNHVKLKVSYKNFPKELRWLCMHGFRLKYIPSELPMMNLVALDMSYSDLEQLWKKPMVKNKSLYNTSEVCRSLTDNLATPAEVIRMDNTNNGSLAEQFDQALAQLIVLGPEMRSRWYGTEDKCDDQVHLIAALERNAQLCTERADQIQLQFEAKQKAWEIQISQLKAEAEELRVVRASDSTPTPSKEDAIRTLGEVNLQHTRVVKGLEEQVKNISLELEVIKATNSQLVHQQSLDKERIQELELEALSLRQERSWLVTQGPKHVMTRSLKSKHFTDALARVGSAHYKVGCHDGVVAGYKQHRLGHSLSQSPFYDSQAETSLCQAKEAFDNLVIPYFDDLAATDNVGVAAFQAVEPMVSKIDDIGEEDD